MQRYFEQHSEINYREEISLLNESTQKTSSIIDWGEAIGINLFFGREQEIQQLQNWIRRDCCRLITICGMGGIGKTALVTKLAKQISGEFEYVMWRSLRNAPTFSELVSESILFLSQQQEVNIPNTLDGQVNCLNELPQLS